MIGVEKQRRPTCAHKSAKSVPFGLLALSIFLCMALFVLACKRHWIIAALDKGIWFNTLFLNQLDVLSRYVTRPTVGFSLLDVSAHWAGHCGDPNVFSRRCTI
jgi:hypothetical protein